MHFDPTDILRKSGYAPKTPKHMDKKVDVEDSDSEQEQYQSNLSLESASPMVKKAPNTVRGDEWNEEEMM